MSVHYNPEKPHWQYHDLADRYRGTVCAIARGFGFDEVDADEFGRRSALKLCLGGFRKIEDKELKSRFLSMCRYEAMAKLDSFKVETPLCRIRSTEKPDIPDEWYYERGSGRTHPTQENSVFLRQCLDAIARLPKNHRRVMNKLAMGHSVVDIALDESRDISQVIEEVNVAREWVMDHMKWGDGEREFFN